MDESFVVLPSNASVMRSHAATAHPSPLGAAAAPQLTPLEAGEALVATCVPRCAAFAHARPS